MRKFRVYNGYWEVMIVNWDRYIGILYSPNIILGYYDSLTIVISIHIYIYTIVGYHWDVQIQINHSEVVSCQTLSRSALLLLAAPSVENHHVGMALNHHGE